MHAYYKSGGSVRKKTGSGMKGMSIKSGDKRPTKSRNAGMTAKESLNTVGIIVSKLQTAVTEKKPKGKRAARRKSFCARSAGQMKKFPSSERSNSRLRQARRR